MNKFDKLFLFNIVFWAFLGPLSLFIKYPFFHVIRDYFPMLFSLSLLILLLIKLRSK
jgi:hypothetical protein